MRIASAAFRVGERGDALDHVLEHVAADDRPSRRPERPGGVDIGLLADADHVVSHHPEVLGHVDRGDRDRRVRTPWPSLLESRNGDDDRQEDVGEGEQGVHDQDEDAVGAAADVAGEEPERDADHEREDDREDDDLDRGPRPPDDPREHVVAADGRAERMAAVGRALFREADTVGADLVEPVRRQERGEDGEEHEEGDDRDADPEDPARDAGRLADRLQPAGEAALSHRYLTRGSMNALIRSISSETMTTAIAKTVTIPCTAT